VVSPDFDVLAASLRSDSGDLRSYLEVLAAKLEDAFPGRTRVDRRGGVFGRGEVERIVLRLGKEEYELRSERGEPVAFRRSIVRGITLKNEELSLEAWVDDLSRALVAEADQSERGREAVEKLLGI
jgi:hypothetical protein